MGSKKIKILTILGTRPEIIRLSRTIPKVDKKFNNVLVHTGQNYDFELDKIFLKQLQMRKPDYYLKARGSFTNQIATIIVKLEKIILKENPKKFLVLGDTNSSIGSIVAQRLNVKVFHMEAGNRCYSKKSPEEVNRRIIDNTSDILLPYTSGSKENLLREGIKKNRIIVTGNPITEVIEYYKDKIERSKILEKLNLKKENYFIITMHRQENVDNLNTFKDLIMSLNLLVNKFNKLLIWPIHPRSKKMLKALNIKIDKRIRIIKPLGFFDFIKLEKNCVLALTDSGTVQEECAIFKKPCLIIREYTERPETIKAGGSLIVGSSPKRIISKANYFMSKKIKIKPIKDYLSLNVSSRVLRVLLKN
tara:strand:+ start:1170 stop:2255 length:1086 start_codon:yes stop_codon:yes gene_type:complete